MDIKNLVANGFFPREITPSFTSGSLGDIVALILPKIDSFDPIGSADPTTGKLKKAKKRTTQCIDFSLPQIGLNRRRISIPNPLSFIRLSNTICDNWHDITSFTSQSKISLSRLVEDKSSTNRALLDPSFEDAIIRRLEVSVSSRYLLKVDISRFYHSIYTHSIPWALHTKEVAKNNYSRFRWYGNALDQDCQKMQDAQTIGIPIGSDTSRIISEIIASAIDIEIQKECPKINGIRIVDDYFLYFDSLSDLEKVLKVLQSQLREFELELNYKKQEVIELPEQIEPPWVYEIRDHWFSNSIKEQRSDLISFFDKAFMLSKLNTTGFVLRYAASRIRKIAVHKSNYRLLEMFMLKMLTIEPKTIPYCVQTFIGYSSLDRSLVNLDLVKETLNKSLKYHSNLQNIFEIAWILWSLNRLGLAVEEECAKLISGINNSVIALEALSCRTKGLIPHGLSTTLWERNMNHQGLYGNNWLLSYEAYVKGWSPSHVDYISHDPFFSLLQSNSVEFYNSNSDLSIKEIKATELGSIVMRD